MSPSSEPTDRYRLSRHHRFWTGRTANGLIMGLTDGGALLGALLLGDVIAEWWYGGAVSLRYSLLVIPAWWLGAIYARLLPGVGYSHLVELQRIGALLALIYGVAAIAIFLGGMAPGTSRASYFISFIAASIFLPLARSAARSALSRTRLWGVDVDIYAPSDRATDIVQAIESDRAFGFRIHEVRPALSSDDLLLVETEKEVSATIAIVAIPAEGIGADSAAFEALMSAYPTVLLVPNWPGAPTLWMEPRDLHGIPALAITNNLVDPRARLLKRTLELTAIALTLPVWAPLTGMLALCVWAGDRHSPFYAQVRIGRGGRPFRSWKLRTMVPDAERALEERMREDPALRAEWNNSFKLRDDPRVTRIGRLLRRWSLDELPQLWNVLRGEMALVGPRPLPEYHHQRLSSVARRLRECVLPGITGLWQVSGRSESSVLDMERWDAYYVRNWSLVLDLIVLAKTVRAVLSRRGAY